MPDATKPEPLVRVWSDLSGKMSEIQAWASLVMKDPRTGMSELRVACALVFMFNSNRCMAWPKNSVLGEAAGIDGETARAAVRKLIKNGHIIKRLETVSSNRTRLMVIRPLMNMGVVKVQPPRVRKGGRKGGCLRTTPLVAREPGEVVVGEPPCNQEPIREENPSSVQGVSSGVVIEGLDDDLEVHAPRAVNRRTG